MKLETKGNSNLVIRADKNNSVSTESIETDNIKIITFLNQPSFSKSTKENYTRILKEFFTFFPKVSLADITDIHIIVYLKSLNKKSATKNLVLKAISSLYGYLVKTGYVLKNPAGSIKPEKTIENFRAKILSFEQIDRMMSVTDSIRNKILLIILYYGGLRVTEVLSLKVKSFSKNQNGDFYMTVIGKGSKVRTVFVPVDIYVKIELYLKSENLLDDDYLFFSNTKSISMTRMQAFRIIKTIAKKAKINPLPSPHWFRHSSATHAIENKAPIHVVQKSLGHASINTTAKYLHASPIDSNANYLKRQES